MADTPALLLIPGLLCDARAWRDVAARLEDVARPQIVEGLADCETINDMARAALAAAPDGPFALAGYSFGGRISLEMLRLAPERVSRLALLDTGYGPKKDGEDQSRLALVERARREGIGVLNEIWLPPMLHPDFRDDPAIAGELRQMVLRQTVDGFERQQRAALTRPDATPVLSTIRVPTLVLVGRDDVWSPVAQHEKLAGLIPGARLTVIEHSGHFTPVEQPGAVAEVMRDWLGWPA